MSGGHPSDEEREQAALPVLEGLLHAAREHDAAGLAALYDEDAVWLAAEDTLRGRDAAVAAHLAVAARAEDWATPQQSGARAALRWSGASGAGGAIVVEVRRGQVVFAASA